MVIFNQLFFIAQMEKTQSTIDMIVFVAFFSLSFNVI